MTCGQIPTAMTTENQLSISLLAQALKKQFISLPDGAHIRACELPFEDPLALPVLDSGVGNVAFIEASRSNDVCAICQMKFQVAAKLEENSS